MKRKRILIPFLLAIAVLLLWWLHNNLQTRSTPSQQNIITASNIDQHHQVQSLSARIKTSKTTRFTEFEAAKEKRQKQREIDEEAVNNEWRTPINFFGKVVDENEQPIEGAQIDFGWTDLSVEGYSRAQTTSGRNGLFTLLNKTGKHLLVKVSKEGYYAYKPYGVGFFYAGENQNFVPDSNNPVVFHLRKKRVAEPLIAIDYPGFAKIAQLSRNGSAVEIDLMKGVKTSVGNGQIKFEFWGDKIERTTRQFNWKLHISVPQGGLVQTDEEFNFQAPEIGYKSDIEIDMPADAEGWYSDFRHKYYIQLPSGNYGRIEFMFMARNGVFTVQSFINPSGSRNLEYDSAVQPK